MCCRENDSSHRKQAHAPTNPAITEARERFIPVDIFKQAAVSPVLCHGNGECNDTGTDHEHGKPAWSNEGFCCSLRGDQIEEFVDAETEGNQ